MHGLDRLSPGNDPLHIFAVFLNLLSEPLLFLFNLAQGELFSGGNVWLGDVLVFPVGFEREVLRKERKRKKKVKFCLFT